MEQPVEHPSPFVGRGERAPEGRVRGFGRIFSWKVVKKRQSVDLQRFTGTVTRFSGSENLKVGLKNLELGLENLSAGPDNLMADPDNLKAGLENLEAAPDNLVAGSENLAARPDNLEGALEYLMAGRENLAAGMGNPGAGRDALCASSGSDWRDEAARNSALPTKRLRLSCGVRSAECGTEFSNGELFLSGNIRCGVDHRFGATGVKPGVQKKTRVRIPTYGRGRFSLCGTRRERVRDFHAPGPATRIRCWSGPVAVIESLHSPTI